MGLANLPKKAASLEPFIMDEEKYHNLDKWVGVRIWPQDLHNNLYCKTFIPLLNNHVIWYALEDLLDRRPKVAYLYVIR